MCWKLRKQVQTHAKEDCPHKPKPGQAQGQKVYSASADEDETFELAYIANCFNVTTRSGFDESPEGRGRNTTPAYTTPVANLPAAHVSPPYQPVVNVVEARHATGVPATATTTESRPTPSTDGADSPPTLESLSRALGVTLARLEEKSDHDSDQDDLDVAPPRPPAPPPLMLYYTPAENEPDPPYVQLTRDGSVPVDRDNSVQDMQRSYCERADIYLDLLEESQPGLRVNRDARPGIVAIICDPLNDLEIQEVSNTYHDYGIQHDYHTNLGMIHSAQRCVRRRLEVRFFASTYFDTEALQLRLRERVHFELFDSQSYHDLISMVHSRTYNTNPRLEEPTVGEETAIRLTEEDAWKRFLTCLLRTPLAPFPLRPYRSLHVYAHRIPTIDAADLAQAERLSHLPEPPPPYVMRQGTTRDLTRRQIATDRHDMNVQRLREQRERTRPGPATVGGRGGPHHPPAPRRAQPQNAPHDRNPRVADRGATQVGQRGRGRNHARPPEDEPPTRYSHVLMVMPTQMAPPANAAYDYRYNLPQPQYQQLPYQPSNFFNPNYSNNFYDPTAGPFFEAPQQSPFRSFYRDGTAYTTDGVNSWPTQSYNQPFEQQLSTGSYPGSTMTYAIARRR